MSLVTPGNGGELDGEMPAKKAKVSSEHWAEGVPARCSARVMTAEEAAAITVPFAEIEAGDRLRKTMAETGTAIVTGVLGSGDIESLEEAIAQDIAELVDVEAIAAADESVRAAWTRAQAGLRGYSTATLMACGARGRLQDRGLPHGRFAWAARRHERVRRVYEVLHGTAELVVSVDNSFVSHVTQPEEQSNKSWPHVDQNDHATDVPCKDWDVYQGILYLWGCESSHASTTVIWPRSHTEPYKLYMADAGVAARPGQGKPHFTLMSGMSPGAARERLFAGWAAEARRIPMPAGALLLWTSRTTHQGWSGGGRLAQPVCWEPRARQDAAMRQRKLRLAALGLPSTHWASLGMPHELLTEDFGAEQRPQRRGAEGSADPDEVILPLRATIRPVTLQDDADQENLWSRFAGRPWFEPLPPELTQLLEVSIREDFKAVL